MLVLGLNGGFSEEDVDLTPGLSEHFFYAAAACLVEDGQLVAAAEEERFNRIKNTTKFPVNAIRACLNKIGARASDIDAVGFYYREDYMDSAINSLMLENPSLRIPKSRQLIKDRLDRELKLQLRDDQLVYTPHHRAHAISTFYRSAFERALVVVLDGTGEDESGTVFRAEGQRLEPLTTYNVPNSLGWLYLRGTQLLGYRLGDEYKVMGLAPYGDPRRYESIFGDLYELSSRGRYALKIHPRLVDYNQLVSAFLQAGFTPRRKGGEFTQAHKDFAAGLQKTLEDIVLHVLKYWSEETGLRQLCFTGGVAHNSTLNGLILRSGMFDEMFVHPASHDAGASEGAALAVADQFDSLPAGRVQLVRSDLGPGIGDTDEVRAALESWRHLVAYEEQDDITRSAVDLLADGAIIGWVQGASEFGPRALGFRSILADARPSANQVRVNKAIKMRESFRPFAPVVTEAAAAEYFELPKTVANYAFMSYVVPVREDRRGELGAVTHVDGSARIQIVSPEANELFHRLVAEFGVRTGTPILLNTSFNNSAEPIVQTIDDALTAFLTTGLDYLFIDKFLVRRRDARPNLDYLKLEFGPTARLAKRINSTRSSSLDSSYEVFLDHTFGPRRSISAALYRLLADSLHTASVGEALRKSEETESLREEVFNLWSDRIIALRPTS